MEEEGALNALPKQGTAEMDRGTHVVFLCLELIKISERPRLDCDLLLLLLSLSMHNEERERSVFVRFC
jgi:hypothetical protein